MPWPKNGSSSKPPPSITESPSPLFADGLILGKYSLAELLQTKDSLTSAKRLLSPETAQTTSMFEFLHTNRKMILKDKSLFYLNSSPITESSVTSGPGSTTTVPDLSPFWNKSKEMLSEKLWLPRKIVSVDLDLNSSNGSASNTTPTSWFSSKMTLPQKKSSLQNSWTSSKFFVAEETGTVDTVIKTLKMPLVLKPHQKQILANWAHTNRYTYNMAIETIETEQIYNKMTLRDMLVTSNSISDNKKWLLETPKVIRQQAVFRAVDNFKSALTNLKNGNISHFRFEKKKQNLWVLNIEKQLKLSKDGTLSMFANKPFKFGNFYCRDKMIKNMKCWKKTKKFPFDKQANGSWKPKADCSIFKDKHNRYYLLIPLTIPKEKCPQSTQKIVSIDPGIRTFLTTYSPDGECSDIGTNCRDRLTPIMKKIIKFDRKLQALSPKEKTPFNKTTIEHKKIKKKKRNLYRKSKDLIRELHDKSIKHLTDNNTTIILGNLNVNALVKKEKRILRAKEVRSLLTLAHGEFRNKLALKCKSKGVTCMLVNEAWTSKTCTSCGFINKALGASKVYNCPCCGMVLDRDINGARNILLRTFGELVVEPVICHR